MLSVVVPVRNDPGHLRLSLASLLASSLPGCELIVVDDASSDETGDVARQAGVRVLRQDTRTGPAGARNRGAQEAHGEIVVFVDADVCVHAETLARIAAAFAADPGVAAVFGSYDTTPSSPAFVSQYKNLAHHFVHQQGSEQPATFWAGCGAIRRAVFEELGGFDTRYSRPCIEDIELGARLLRAGHRIALRKDVQATHLKRWTLLGMIRSDVWDRGIPWTELVLRERILPDDLNLRTSQRVAAVVAWLLFALLAAFCWRAPALLAAPLAIAATVVAVDAWTARRWPPAGAAVLGLSVGAAVLALAVRTLGAWSLVPLALAGVLLWLNRPFYAFLARVRHPLFALGAIPLHLLYYWYSGIALAVGTARYLWRAARSS